MDLELIYQLKLINLKLRDFINVKMLDFY